MNESTKYLIIGSGPAAVAAAEQIRRLDGKGRIAMVSADRYPACSPVMLSYWVSGHHPQSHVYFRDPASWPSVHGIDFIPEVNVVSVDTDGRFVRVHDGRQIRFEKLLIATGGAPFVPPIPGIRAAGVHVFRNIDNAQALLSSCGGRNRVIIMGGGFIGLKLACHLKDRDIQAFIVEREPRLASRMFDIVSSGIIAEYMNEQGISVKTGTEVTEILEYNGAVAGIRTKDGVICECDSLVVAVGVRPNIDLLKGTGIETRGGVVVDARMETNVEGIFAAGDVTVTMDSLTHTYFNNATWPAATRQGKIAGANMAGSNQAYVHNFNMNSLRLIDLQIASAGHAADHRPDDLVVGERNGRLGYRKIVVREDRIIGFILMDDVASAGVLLSRMRRGDRVRGPADLLPDTLRQPYCSVPPVQGPLRGVLGQRVRGRPFRYDLKRETAPCGSE